MAKKGKSKTTREAAEFPAREFEVKVKVRYDPNLLFLWEELGVANVKGQDIRLCLLHGQGIGMSAEKVAGFFAFDNDSLVEATLAMVKELKAQKGKGKKE